MKLGGEAAFRGPVEAARLERGEAFALLRRVLPMLRPYTGSAVLGLGLVLAHTAAVLVGPYLVKRAIDDGIRADRPATLDRLVWLYIGVVVVSYGLNRAQIGVVSRVGESLLRDLRVRVFDHLLRLSMTFYDREKAGVIVSRMTSDVDSLQELVQMGLLSFASNLALVVLAVVVLALTQWQLLLVCLVTVPLVLVESVRFQRRSSLAYMTVRERIGRTLSHLQESITGVRVTQAFAREQGQVRRFSEESQALYAAHLSSVRAEARYLPVIELGSVLTTALVVGVGGWMVQRAEVTLGTVTFFILTLGYLFEPVQQLSQLFNQLQSAAAGLKKLFALLDTRVELADPAEPQPLPERGDLELVDVGFRYRPEAARVLGGVHLRIAAGERLALVGPTGAGKSTLAKLVARLYDATEGELRFGGVPLRAASYRALRQRIVFVPQEGFLFNASVRDNLRVVREGADDAMIEQALDAIGARARFEALPQGLDTLVNERGASLSAGEKQLLSLARAALVDPAVLILDEATSSLDPGTEGIVEVALQQLTRGRTVIVIAHRLTTAERADRIAVVADGRLVELGSHAELLAMGGHYARMYAAWVGGGRGS